ncbi:unnamed protein product [Mytilus edulis]|uniref:HEPN domain-containing protein n=1 Tax=Mytilus edulis TaxID=6550 RepID=A0A8S3VDE5_MYTED|nr:unnamed protein product [Mytilus edulis]
MMGFDRLDILAHGNIVSSFKQLPEKMQPCILSDMITSEIDEESFTKINDRRGQILREYLASAQFQEAIVRISVHCRKDLKLPKMKEDDIKAMVSGIENIKIVQVESIKQRLTYKGKTVGQDQLTAYCQSQDETSQHTLFCAFNEYKIQEWLSESFLNISEALSKCTNYLYCDTKGFLMTVLNFIENPNNITKALDRARVEQYSVSKKSRNSVFPPAGVTVHEEWHCFLDNSFSDFDVGDYVALLLSEEKMDGDEFIPAEHFRTWERDTTEDKNYSEQRSQSSSGCGTSSGRRQHKQEVSSVAEARQWMRQAKLDFTAAKQFLPSAETGLILIGYASCSVEKVLKALHFHKDCNDVPSTNDLLQLSASLDQNLQVMVKTLVDVIGPREKNYVP